jgi:ribonuclease VapC
VDEDLARRACQIFQRFGKGQGHGSQLHFGDCFAAALADRDQCPLACVGEDFRAAGF